MSDMYISVSPTSSWHHIPTVGLLLTQVATGPGVVVFLITRHCYKKTSQKNSPSKGDNGHAQVEGPSTYEDIAMTESLAYVSVHQK